MTESNEHLSEVEHKVLLGASRGETCLATAHRMERSIETIKSHRKKILARLHAANMTEAVAIAHQRGILGEGPRVPRPASDGQIGMLHAKLGELDQKVGRERGTSKEAILTAVSRQFDRAIGSVYELEYREASWCIDTTIDQLRADVVEQVSILEVFG